MLYRQKEVFRDGFRGLFQAGLGPPAEGFHEGGGDVVEPKVLRELVAFSCGEQGQLALDQPGQIAFEVLQKQLIILSCQKLQNLIIVSLQVPEQVQKHGIRGVAVKNMLVVVAFHGVKEVAKQLFTQGLQQILLGFKVGIEGGSAHIRQLDDLAHGDLTEVLGRKQSDQCRKNRFPGFSLSSVHKNTVHFLNFVPY